MIAVPAVDLREGACVQLVGGDYAAERIRLPDPLAVAAEWAALGFSCLHVVDLDRATRRGDNTAVVERIVARGAQRLQVGGGVDSEQRIARLLDAGVATVVVGTKALEEQGWLGKITERWPGRIVLAADVDGRDVVTRGWSHRLGITIDALLPSLAPLPLGGVLVTAVHREGQLEGPDLALVTDVVAGAPWPVQASGGITSLDDLRALDRIGAARAVIGMALYTGRLDARAAAGEFGS